MKKLVVLGLAAVLAGGVGAGSVAAKDGAGTAAKAGAVWTCPMHSQVKMDKAGSCPICGMNLVEKKAPAPAAAGVLSPYFAIRRALASDDFGMVSMHAHHLAAGCEAGAKTAKPNLASALGAIAKKAHALGALGKKADPKAIRVAFGEVSKAALAYAETANAVGALKAPVHVFHCSMAKPYGTWLQADAATGNPYLGKSMPGCGREVKTLDVSADAPKGAGMDCPPGSSCCKG